MGGLRPNAPEKWWRAAADFVLATPADHGRAGIYHLLGIESPGSVNNSVRVGPVLYGLVLTLLIGHISPRLTASLSLADQLVAAVDAGEGA